MKRQRVEDIPLPFDSDFATWEAFVLFSPAFICLLLIYTFERLRGFERLSVLFLVVRFGFGAPGRVRRVRILLRV